MKRKKRKKSNETKVPEIVKLGRNRILGVICCTLLGHLFCGTLGKGGLLHHTAFSFFLPFSNFWSLTALSGVGSLFTILSLIASVALLRAIAIRCDRLTELLVHALQL